MTAPYHKYVFDTQRRRFVGKFEEMYQAEDQESYDSWFQEDLRSLVKQLSLVLLGRYNFSSILDAGCGKGTFTHLLKRQNNRVVGIDLSETAIRRARARYPDIEFRAMPVEEIGRLEERFDLAVAMELLSYIEGWRALLHTLSQMSTYLYVTLYLPSDPIGFVKSFTELREAIGQDWQIENDLVLNSSHILVFARSRARG